MPEALPRPSQDDAATPSGQELLLRPGMPARLTNSAAEAARAWAAIAGHELEDENDLSARFTESLDRSRNYFASPFTLGISPPQWPRPPSTGCSFGL